MENNLAYIDFTKCKLCRKCVEACPTEAIHELNFPPRKEKKEEEARHGDGVGGPVPGKTIVTVDAGDSVIGGS